MFPEKVFAAKGGFDAGGEGVADIGGGDAVLGEESFFEGEDAQKAVYDAAHGFDAAFAPGPDLRGDQVDDGDA